VVIEKKYRTFWRRFWAGNVDAIVLSPIGLLDHWFWTQHTPVSMRLLWFALSSLVWPVYSIYLHGRFGQTVGKRLLRIKVVDVSGEALTMIQALRRELVNLPFSVWSMVTGLTAIARGGSPHDSVHGDGGLLVGLSLALFGLELVSTLGSRQRRALHDFVAGSLVVRLDVRVSQDHQDSDDTQSSRHNSPAPYVAHGQFGCLACGNPVNFGASSCSACEASFVYRQGRPELETRV
jgi:uncharacterized RDD family membrane protein YckC